MASQNSFSELCTQIVHRMQPRSQVHKPVTSNSFVGKALNHIFLFLNCSFSIFIAVMNYVTGFEMSRHNLLGEFQKTIMDIFGSSIPFLNVHTVHKRHPERQAVVFLDFSKEGLRYLFLEQNVMMLFRKGITQIPARYQFLAKVDVRVVRFTLIASPKVHLNG